MSQAKLIKQRVCIAIFTLGLSLAAFVEIGCSPDQSHMAHSPIKNISLTLDVKG